MTPMLNRRSFLRWSVATGLGLHSISTARAAEELPLDVLGRPRSWSLVRTGYHPISPKRVIVMTVQSSECWSNRDRRIEDSLRASLSEPFDLCSWCGVPMGRYEVPAGKLDPIFRLIRVLTDHYRVPHLFSKWATMLAKREALGSTGMGHGFGLLHQFQDDGMVPLVNAPVDWWLVLFPGGIEWEAVDGKPVHAMIGHVFATNHFQLPGLKLRAWELASRAVREFDADTWTWIAGLDRIAAAQEVNRALIRALA